jgi:RNA polymerase sigma-70 factor (ECF subfamily)
MKPRTEQDLLKAAQTFDMDALASIYDQYSPGVYRYALRLLGDECLAEDCVSETFSRLLKALRNGQGPNEYLQAYLYRVAHNWITDSYRRAAPPQMELDEGLHEEEHLQPETQADRRIEQEEVRLAFRALTPDQRQVIALRFLEGWEHQEIAAALQKPAGAIRALQHRAIHTLKGLLLKEEKGVEYGSDGRARSQAS